MERKLGKKAQAVLHTKYKMILNLFSVNRSIYLVQISRSRSEVIDAMGLHTIDFYLIFCNADVLVNDCRLVRCSPSTSTLMGGFNPLLSDVGGLVRVIVNPAPPYLLSTLVEFS